MLMLAIVGVLLAAAFLRTRNTKITGLGRKDMERHRQASEMERRSWRYPFE